MSKPRGILIFGANGSGKTTVGRELACILNFKHMDIEDYCFRKSEIPYTNPRSRDECTELMLADIEKHPSFVLSAVTGNFGNQISLMYELAVLISAPKEIRIKRIAERAFEQYGERVRIGGDMYERELRFYNFAATRSLSKIEQWAQTLSCPILRIDGTEDYKKTAADIAARYDAKPDKRRKNINMACV